MVKMTLSVALVAVMLWTAACRSPTSPPADRKAGDNCPQPPLGAVAQEEPAANSIPLTFTTGGNNSAYLRSPITVTAGSGAQQAKNATAYLWRVAAQGRAVCFVASDDKPAQVFSRAESAQAGSNAPPSTPKLLDSYTFSTQEPSISLFFEKTGLFDVLLETTVTGQVFRGQGQLEIRPAPLRIAVEVYGPDGKMLGSSVDKQILVRSGIKILIKCVSNAHQRSEPLTQVNWKQSSSPGVWLPLLNRKDHEMTAPTFLLQLDQKFKERRYRASIENMVAEIFLQEVSS